MSRPNYYGVYGRNRAGIYNSYEKLQTSRRYIVGFKLKGFLFKKDAVQYVVKGLSEVYRVMPADKIDTDLLAKSVNWCYTLPDLTKKIDAIIIVNT